MTNDEYIEGLAKHLFDGNMEAPVHDIAQAIADWHREHGLRVVTEKQITDLIELADEYRNELITGYGFDDEGTPRMSAAIEKITEIVDAAKGERVMSVDSLVDNLYDRIDHLQSELEVSQKQVEIYFNLIQSLRQAEKTWQSELEAERGKVRELYELLSRCPFFLDALCDKQSKHGYAAWQLYDDIQAALNNTTAPTEAEIRHNERERIAEWMMDNAEKNEGVMFVELVANELRQRVDND